MQVTSPDNTARYVLGKLGTKNLILFGANPSTATDNVSDPTSRSIERYCQAHNFDGWLILNLYPQRTPDPKGLHTEVNLELHSENIKHIEQVLSQARNFTLCAAWGNLIQERDYLTTSLKSIVEFTGDSKWFCIGELTKEGHPRHPLYMSADSPLLPFAMKEYLNRA